VVAGKRAVIESLRAGRVRELLVSEGARHNEGMREVEAAASAAGVRVRRVLRAELDALAADHRGVVARVERPRNLGERDVATLPFAEDAVVVTLDGVVDPQNLGAAARSADAAGVAVLITRMHRSAGVTDSAFRASAGALVSLPHARVANLPRVLERLRDAGFVVVGLDPGAPGSIYEEPCPRGRIVLVVGSEGTGLSRLVRERCDLLVSLPMLGHVASLNVAAGLAAALFAWIVPSRA